MVLKLGVLFLKGRLRAFQQKLQRKSIWIKVGGSKRKLEKTEEIEKAGTN
jgi:hypothetical protein